MIVDFLPAFHLPGPWYTVASQANVKARGLPLYLTRYVLSWDSYPSEEVSLALFFSAGMVFEALGGLASCAHPLRLGSPVLRLRRFPGLWRPSPVVLQTLPGVKPPRSFCPRIPIVPAICQHVSVALFVYVCAHRMLPFFFGESEAVSIVLSWRDVLSAPTAAGASSLPARSPVPFVERFSHRCSRFSCAGITDSASPGLSGTTT